MQTNTQRFFEEGNGIKANPLLESLRATRIFFIIAIILWILLFLFLSFIFIGGGGYSSGYPMLFVYIVIMVLNIVNLVTITAQIRYWERIEQRRFALMQWQRTALAFWQLGSNVTSMRLPLTMKLRYTKKYLLLLIVVYLLMATFVSGAQNLKGDSWPFTFAALPHLLVSFFLAMVFLCALGFVTVFSRAGRQQVEVTETGITTWYARKVATVEWEEARLFAMYNTFGAQKSGAAITYELSSARDIVRWTWVRRKTFFVSQEPTLPLDEYNRQMQELRALVEARTGLALYDLRH
jgi:hypothetical protein